MNKSAQRKRFLIITRSFSAGLVSGVPGNERRTRKHRKTVAQRKFRSPRQMKVNQVFLFAKVRLEIFDGKGFVNSQKAVMTSLKNHRKLITEGASD